MKVDEKAFIKGQPQSGGRENNKIAPHALSRSTSEVQNRAFETHLGLFLCAFGRFIPTGYDLIVLGGLQIDGTKRVTNWLTWYFYLE